MMNCTCGIPAFYYETIKSDNLKYSVYKCGTLSSESKRGKCVLNVETLISKIKIPCRELICQEIESDKIVDTKKEIYKNLEKYIYLLEISKNNYGMSKDNYISNINFILKKLTLPLFFEKNEKLMSLKFRIYDIPSVKIPKKTLYPISILEIPENLKIKNKKLIRKNKIITNKNPNKITVSRLVLEPKDIIDSIKKLEIRSDADSGSDSGNEDDNSFDIDNSNSEMEDNFCEDGGEMSD